ncbi:hypothetical protein RDI58_003647 [Solanum bulbocastanum]|uniref:Uncharacterized protein n=1 Tax=Solanum bulbocastanum TaxID=147425 RepID=A0AAN8YV75_SOLBU
MADVPESSLNPHPPEYIPIPTPPPRARFQCINISRGGVKVFPGSNRRVELAIAYIQGENALRRQFQSAKYASEVIGFYPPRDGY